MEAEGIIMGFDESTETSFADHESSKCRRPTDSAAIGARPSASACFDCSICLDFVVDPVVTLCGHLYCWPCIYKWLQIETISPHQCPVCKSSLSLNALVPLYGRGKTNFTSKSKGLDIPNRPSVVEEQHSSAIYQRRPVQQHHNHHYYPSPWGGMGIFSSTTGGMLGGLAIAIVSLVLRNNQSGREPDFPRPNHLMMPSVDSANQRMQRVENSLHQIWLFLFCCAILGLLFF